MASTANYKTHLTKTYGTIPSEYWLDTGESPHNGAQYCLSITGRSRFGLPLLPRMAASKYYADKWEPCKYSEIGFLCLGEWVNDVRFNHHLPATCSYAQLKKAAKACSAVYTDLPIEHPFVAYLVQWGLLVLHLEPWPNLLSDSGATDEPGNRWLHLRRDLERWQSIQSLQRGYVRAMLGVNPIPVPSKLASEGHQSTLDILKNGRQAKVKHLLRTTYSLGG